MQLTQKEPDSWPGYDVKPRFPLQIIVRPRRLKIVRLDGQMLIAQTHFTDCLMLSRSETAGTARAAREKKTLQAMMRIYCTGQHRPDHAPCVECRQLLAYAENRIERCPLIANKPTCAKCNIHCFDKSHRGQIRMVMRYSGPRMIYHHPILTIRHAIDGRR